VPWPTSGLAKHLGDEIFESRRRDPVMGLIDAGVRIQSRVHHDLIDQVVNDRRDIVDAAKSII
jgi:hypothetical protein